MILVLSQASIYKDPPSFCEKDNRNLNTLTFPLPLWQAAGSEDQSASGDEGAGSDFPLTMTTMGGNAVSSNDDTASGQPLQQPRQRLKAKRHGAPKISEL